MATHVTFHNGAKMPIIGLGTWQSKPEDAIRAVEAAIDAGYRHIDTAYAYKNEKDIGTAIKNKIAEGKVKREDLFIVTKLSGQFMHKEDVIPILKKQLTDLQMDYVDLFLIHTPFAFQKDPNAIFPMKDGKPLFDMDVDLVETWKGMEDACNAGLTKSIGLSNFSSRQIKRICDNATIKPANLQVECHAYFRQKELHDFCKQHGITFCAYAPLGSPDRSGSSISTVVTNKPMNDPVIKSLAEKNKKTEAQVLLRYLIQRGIVVIPKSVTPSRIQQNIDIFDFQLTPEEMDKINNLSINERTFKVEIFASHPEYFVNDPLVVQ